jgi:hypothetical protein
MLSGMVRHIQLTVKSKTGINSTVILLAAIAALAGMVAFGLLILAAFIWLAERYSPLTSSLILLAFFLVVAVACGAGSVMSHRRAMTQAKLALQARSNQPWLDPKFLAVGLQIGKSVGMRRIVPLFAAGLLAATLAKEWFGDRGQTEPYDQS